jgi:molybdenum cofactor cytidylyltransferase
MAIAGLFLAAGFSRRFGTANKLAQPLADGRAMGLVAAQHLLQAIPYSIAVIRPDEHELAELFAAAGLKVVRCAQHQQEMADSLAAAVNCATDAVVTITGFVIALADMPFIRSSIYAQVVHKLEQGEQIVIPTYQGQRGHPVGFAASFQSELSSLHGDTGARSLIKKYPQAVHLFDCDDPGILMDIDTVDELQQQTKSGTSLLNFDAKQILP